jgi:electron transfer flavoprotein beta subunit
MKIIVLLKRVPDLVEDLEVDSTGKALDTEVLKFTLNEFDDYALEEALLLKEATGGEVTAVALDGEDVDKMLYTALAKGADRALKITGAGAPADNRALARIVHPVLAARPHDLLLTGVQAADDRDGQVGPMVAALAGVPCVEVVTKVIPGGPGTVVVHKEYAGGVVAEFEVALPAVLGIQTAGQPPRYAPVSKVRQVQESTTLDTVAAPAGDGGGGISVVVMTPPETGEGAQMLTGVGELVAVLESKGVI